MLNETFVECTPEVNSDTPARYGYVYLTRAVTPKAVLWYVGQRSSPKKDPKYFGSGKVIHRLLKKYGSHTLQTEVMGWANTLDELNALEIRLIAWARAEYGKYCINIANGGQSFTSADIKRALSYPSVRARMSRALKNYFEDPASRVKCSEAQKRGWAKPEAKRNGSEANRRRYADPNARKLASEKAIRRYETTNARQLVVEDNVARYTATQELREKWKVVKSELKRAGIPHPRTTGMGVSRLTATIEQFENILTARSSEQ
jgi:hypothetical protein